VKDRQYNDKKKKYQKGQTMTHKTLHRKLTIEQQETGVTSFAVEG